MTRVCFKGIATLLCVMFIALISQSVAAQTKTIKGKVTDEVSKEPLIGCNVLIKGSDKGTTTDLDGKFSLSVDLPATLVFSYLGYVTFEVEVITGNEVENVILKEQGVTIGQEIVITGSRVSERIIESPISIQKITSRDIMNTASGNFYQGMGNLKDVDVTTSSLGFQIVNTRGFNTTAPVRMVQFIDGMDNQAPGLNFPVGNLVGASDIDLASIELISGAASAMYGPNAFQGVVSMISKDPFNYPGLQMRVKGGSREMFDGQVRYANSFGRMQGDKKMFGYKFTASYFRALDWIANTPDVNRYGDVSTDLRISDVVRSLQFSDDEETANTFRKLNAYLDFYPVALPGVVSVTAPGYMEEELSDNTVNSLKLGGNLYYNITKDLQLNYLYKFGRGTAIYQGANRYAVKNILFQQHKIELVHKNFFIKAYTTLEDAGDAYDIVFTGIGLSRKGFRNFVSDYISEYFGRLGDLTNEFKDGPSLSAVNESKDFAFNSAYNTAFFKPGTPEFEAAFNEIVSNPDLQVGSKFQDKSSFHHVEGQYNLNFKKVASFNIGGSFRMFQPQSFGTIFRDTLLPDGNYVNLDTWETGGYVQGTFDVIKEKLKLIGSFRADKHMNFDVQYSPRISAVFSHKGHVVRVSAQQAFRAPTLQNQYILLNLGPITLKGNLDGVPLSYTLNSVTEFRDKYRASFEVDPSLLVTAAFKPLQPEQVKTIEAGYRGIIKNKVFIDFTAYFNQYSNFIGDIRLVQPREPGVVGQETGVDQVLLGNYDVLQYAVNASQDVRTYGASIGLNYYIWKGLMAYGNYTYSNIDTKDLTDPILPGFNTPRNKINIGIGGQNLYKGFGFNANLKWVEAFFWESPFGDGQVPTFVTLDMNVSYELDKYLTFQLGGSNITNSRVQQAFGSPVIGGMVYASVLFDLERKGKK